MKFPIFFTVIEKRRKGGKDCLPAVCFNPCKQFPRIGDCIGIVCRAKGNIIETVFGTYAFYVQCSVKRGTQTAGKCHWSAEIQDITGNLSSLGKTGNGLVDDGLVDGSGDIGR